MIEQCYRESSAEKGDENVAILNFSAFAQAVQSGTANMDPTNVVRLILDSVTTCGSALNPAKDVYFEPKECNEYFKAETNVSPRIAEATKESAVCRFAQTYFEDTFVDAILPQRENNVVENIVNTINGDATIPHSTRVMFETLVDNEEYPLLYYQVFLYCLGSPNNQNKDNKKKKKAKSDEVWACLTELDTVMKQFPKPVQLIPPDILAETELEYATQLLAAYSDDANEDINCDNILQSKYATHYKRQRKDYYSAESVRRAVLEAFSTDEDVFGDFKKEVHSLIVDEYEDQQGNRPLHIAKAIIKYAGNANVSKSVLVHLPKWVGAEEKKGACHMLVNDGEIKWVEKNDDEKNL